MEILVIVRQKSKNVPIFLSMDGANKKGMHHIVKVLTFWDADKNCLCVYQLDTDAVLGTNKGATEAVNYSLEKIDTNNFKVLLYGTATDAGGGIGDFLPSNSYFNESKEVYYLRALNDLSFFMIIIFFTSL